MAATVLLCVVLLEIERRILALSGPNVCYNDTANIFRCCTGFENKDEKCVPCPPGRFGLSCTETCEPGYYGESCLSICNCRENEVCKPDTGCDDPFSGSASNNTNSFGLNQESLIGTKIFPAILAVTMIILTLFLICLIKHCVCKSKELTTGGIEGAVNSSNDTDVRMNGAASHGNQHHCSLATDTRVYGDVGHDFNEYDLLELRLRNVSCVSADLDRFEHQDEYVYFQQDSNARNKTTVADCNTGTDNTETTDYDCASNVNGHTFTTGRNDTYGKEAYQNV